jgi:hypothetical protein
VVLGQFPGTKGENGSSKWRGQIGELSDNQLPAKHITHGPVQPEKREESVPVPNPFFSCFANDTLEMNPAETISYSGGKVFSAVTPVYRPGLDEPANVINDPGQLERGWVNPGGKTRTTRERPYNAFPAYASSRSDWNALKYLGLAVGVVFLASYLRR